MQPTADEADSVEARYEWDAKTGDAASNDGSIEAETDSSDKVGFHSAAVISDSVTACHLQSQDETETISFTVYARGSTRPTRH